MFVFILYTCFILFSYLPVDVTVCVSVCVSSQVYLGGYCHAFRFCPGGQHVEYREGSRTAHEGTVEFISLDAHKGAGLLFLFNLCPTHPRLKK